MNKTVIKLFKAVVGDYTDYSKEALKYGIVMPNCDSELVDRAIELYGNSSELFTSTFHKSFDEIEDTDELTLLVEQCLHYLTTYGSDFSAPYVYIPAKDIDVPALDVEQIKFVSINSITVEQLKDKIITLCSVALSLDTVQDVVELIEYYELLDIVDAIKNKEVKCILCRALHTVPSDPNEMLRYMIYLATGSTLKIKNNDTLLKIKRGTSLFYGDINSALNTYIGKYGYRKLASIFISNKNLFLMFKNSENAAIMNKLNKLGKKRSIRVTHTPNLIEKFTNTNEDITLRTASKAIEQVSVFKHMALLDILNYVSASPKYMEYKIRNGKVYIKEAKEKDINKINQRRNLLYYKLMERTTDKIEGKTFYIPSGIRYSLPTSEKQFIGNIPNKTKIELENDEALIVAVEWETECDIDLSVIDSDGDKLGWNGDFKNARALFSGDMTKLADNGRACEAVLIDAKDVFKGNVNINLYSAWGTDLDKIPFKFIIAKASKRTRTLKLNYTIDPNKVLVMANLEIDRKANYMSIGTVLIDNDKTTLPIYLILFL